MKLALSFHRPPLPQFQHWEEYICSRFRFESRDLAAWMREIMAGEGELGQRLSHYLEKGQVVPARLLDEFLWHGIEALESEKILLPGFPRDLRQAEGLDRILRHFGYPELRFVCLEFREPDRAIRQYMELETDLEDLPVVNDPLFEERIFEALQRYDDRLSALLRHCPSECLLKLDPLASEEQNRARLDKWLGNWVLEQDP